MDTPDASRVYREAGINPTDSKNQIQEKLDDFFEESPSDRQIEAVETYRQGKWAVKNRMVETIGDTKMLLKETDNGTRFLGKAEDFSIVYKETYQGQVRDENGKFTSKVKYKQVVQARNTETGEFAGKVKERIVIERDNEVVEVIDNE